MNKIYLIAPLAGLLVVIVAITLFVMTSPTHCELTNLQYEDIATCK